MASHSLPSSSACLLPVSSIIAHCGVDPSRGLSYAVASERRLASGGNELRKGEEETILQKFIEKGKEPMILLLLSSAVISVITHQYDDAISIAMVRH
jgi:Ca2+-transporting ATPase